MTDYKLVIVLTTEDGLSLKQIEDKFKSMFKQAKIKSPIKSINLFKEPIKKGDYSEEFLRFWEAYPKKTGKGEANRIWQAQGLDTLVTECLKTLSWQKKLVDWKKEKGQYIPMPSTWLNQRRWEDEDPTEGVERSGYQDINGDWIEE